MGKSVTVKELAAQFDLEIFGGEAGLDRELITSDLYRPGLELDFFSPIILRKDFRCWDGQS